VRQRQRSRRQRQRQRGRGRRAMPEWQKGRGAEDNGRCRGAETEADGQVQNCSGTVRDRGRHAAVDG
jgi:hypothetical protein